MKPRRKKGRHREMNKNNPFSGGTTVFCKQTNKKQKEKKGLGPTAPKHTCRVASTQTQEENAEKSKTRKEERGVSKDPFSNSQKRCRKKSPGKLGKTIRTAAASRFLATARLEPKPRQSCAPKTRQNFTNWSPPGKNGKNVIFKTTSALQPQAVFCLPNPIWSKIRTSEKTNL